MGVESVQQIFCRVADQWPSRTAIAAGARQASYAELDRLSDDRAGFLAGAGAARGTMAALLIDDPVEMVIALLACLKAGCVFVPIDPRLPPARIEAMLAVARPAWLLAETSLLPLLERLAPAALAGVAVARVDGADAGAHPAERRVLCPADPDQMCYVYFTSGSTGPPKGIAGRLKAIDHFVRWEIDTFAVTPETRVSHLTSPAFDASLRDVFVPLCAGGTICVPASRETILDTPRLLQWLEEERVQVLHCVPSLFRALLNAGRAPLGLPDLRHVLLAGEPLLPADVGRWLDLYGERTRLVNLYGPTETTMTKFAYLVQPGDRGRRRIPIGKPIRGARALVVDGRGAVCVPGQAGEIWIRTPFRTLGYLGQPELTREVFIPNPFGDGAAADVVYKTGDLGRVLDDGNFEFLGRIDQQVKIRGVRVELAEIESHLRAHAAVEDVAVVDRDDQDGGNKVLCAYVVTREPVPAERLQQHLAARLPEQAVPSLFVELAELPRTVTGKVDRRALPAPSRVARQAAAPPRNAVEELVAGAWEQVLHASGFGTAESFFTVGGDSLLFVQVLARIRQLFRVEMPLRAFFEAPTIAGLAQAVETALRRGQGPSLAPMIPVAPQEPPASLPPIGPIGRRARGGPSALSFAQERLWFLDRLNPGNPAYNVGLAVRIKGDLAHAALARGLTEVVRRHEVLRSSFPLAAGRPVQAVAAPAAVSLPAIDLGPLPAPRREAARAAIAAAAEGRPFDLARGPVLRAGLIRMGARDHLLLIAIHHIATDGWSQEVLLGEVAELYAAAVRGQVPRLPRLHVQYADFAAWQRETLQGERLRQLTDYWRRQLTPPVPVLELPTDRPRPAVQTARGAGLGRALAPALLAGAKALARGQGVTLYMVLLAAFEVLLSRLTGQRELCVGTPVAGRVMVETESLVGLFLNTLAIRGDLGRAGSFGELLGQVRETMVAAQAHQDLPFEKLVEELQPRRDLRHSPLFQVMLVLQNAPRAAFELPGIELEVQALDSVGSKFDLTLGFAEQPGSEAQPRLAAYLEYNPDLFDRATMIRLLDHLETLLQAALRDPAAALDSLPMLSAAERRQLLVEWNDTAVPEAEAPLVPRLFEAQVERSPDAVAVAGDRSRLSYRELNARANQLAHLLRELGAGPDVRVGVCVEREPELLVAVLAILKAGAAYLPLDPRHPPRRLAWLLQDAAAPLLLAGAVWDEHGAGAAAAAVRVLRLEQLAPDLARRPGANPEAGPDPLDLAYVMYTSGSTGQPKGVAVSHRGLANFLAAMHPRLGLRAADRLLALTPLSFDISGLELFLPLAVGARVQLVPPQAALDGRQLLARLETEQPTVIQTTPAGWRLLMDAGWQGQTELAALCGGEALPEKLAGELTRSCPRGWNLYGPTETTIWSTAARLSRRAGPAAPVTLGRPLDNTQIHLLDRRLEPVPVGVAGELFIGGAGLARGYLGRPDLTAERFVPSPFAVTPGARLFRTGDAAALLPDGRLRFLGRTDQQIKLRGYRIEPGEVEALLERQAEVERALVMVREDAPGDRRLVAYLVAPDGKPPRTGELLAALRQELPDYMVPQSFVALRELPLTANGKVDRAALPPPEGARPELHGAYQAPRAGLESKISRIWQDVLRVDRVGVADNFFDLGGHSLLLIEMHGRLEAELQVELPVLELFQYPTVAALAARLLRRDGEREAQDRERGRLAGLQAGRERLRRRGVAVRGGQ